MLNIKGLTISYGNNLVIDDVDLEFEIGTTCLIGESGCGKSSILNALVHQIDFKSKSYSLNEIDLKEENTAFFREKVAYLCQNNNFISDLSCFDNMRLFASFHDVTLTDEEIKKYLNVVGLDYITKKNYPDNLSGGEKQRLAIAQALAKQSDIILCDEITAALDQETKLEVFNILQSLENKIIIMTSHDEDIYLQCQKIYRIIDKKAILEKEEKKNSVALNQSIKNNSIPVKLLNRYVFSKYDRQKMYSILYSLITAIVVALCAFLTFFTINSLHEQNIILERLSQNQIYVVNQTTPTLGNDSHTYYYNNRVFEENIEDELNSIEGISAIYPYYWISMSDPQAQDYEEIQFFLSYDDKEDKVIETSGASYDFSLIPYTKEQNFDKKMQIINPENQAFGVYVNHIFLLMTGLTEKDLVGATIKTTVYPPVGYTKEEMTYINRDTKEQFKMVSHMPVGMPVEVHLPVLGFVDFWYNDDWGIPIIYCPIEYMESLRAEVVDKYQPSEGEFIWNQNAYMVFVDDLEKMEEVNIQIRGIDENIATGNKYMDNTAMYEQKRYIEITSSVAVVVVLLAGTILSYVYGIYYYQKQQNDLLYMRRNMLLKKEFNQLLVLDCIYQIVINVLFAIPVVFCISYFGQIYLNMLRFEVISKESAIIFSLLILLTIIQTLISRIHYYKNGKPK